MLYANGISLDLSNHIELSDLKRNISYEGNISSEIRFVKAKEQKIVFLSTREIKIKIQKLKINNQTKNIHIYLLATSNYFYPTNYLTSFQSHGAYAFAVSLQFFIEISS